MNNKPTPTIEDYLGIVYILERDGEKVIGARLADILHVSPPTVTVTLKRMVRDGWIEIDHKKQVHLTPKGHDAATSVMRRHMLTEWLLSDVLEIPWSDLHDEAHKIEHSISKDVEEKLAETMDKPDICPHGNPLPGQESVAKDWIPLTDFSSGDICILKRIHELIEEDNDAMQFLIDNQILPGCEIQIRDRGNELEKLNIQIKNKSISVPLQIAKKLFAE